MNGTWVKTKYTSKIAQNTEVEDDVKTLYDSISNNSTNIRDISTNLSNISTNLSNISTNLSDNYITKSQYLEDEELIASTFANVNNKINSLQAEIAELKEQLNNKA